MEKLKISIIGNSVALRVIPATNSIRQLNYGNVLETLLLKKMNMNLSVENNSIGASIITDVTNKIDYYVNSFPDYYIINLGVVDASSREIPRWYFKIINKWKLNSIGHLLKFIHLVFIKPLRPYVVYLRGRRGWTSPNQFRKLFDKLINYLLRETKSKIIILPINNTTDRIVKNLPGSENKYKIFSGIMKNIAKKYKQVYINLDDLDPLIHCPDGIHFSELGHQVVAEKIMDIIINDVKKSN